MVSAMFMVLVIRHDNGHGLGYMNLAAIVMVLVMVIFHCHGHVHSLVVLMLYNDFLLISSICLHCLLCL